MADTSKKRARKSKLMPREYEETDAEIVTNMQKIKYRKILPMPCTSETEPKKSNIDFEALIDADKQNTVKSPPMAFSVTVAVEEFDESDHELVIDEQCHEKLRKVPESKIIERPLAIGQTSNKDPAQHYVLERDVILNDIEKIYNESQCNADRILSVEARNIMGHYQKYVLNAFEVKLDRVIEQWQAWKCVINLKYKATNSLLLHKCYICKKSWWHLHDFKEHLLDHVNFNLFVEEYSKFEVNIIAALTLKAPEIQNFETEGPCPNCSEEYIIHIITENGENGSRSVHNNSMYKCNISNCPKLFSTCCALRQHKYTNHTILEIKGIDMTTSKWMNCPICGFVFTTPESYKEHMICMHSVRSDVFIAVGNKKCLECHGEVAFNLLHECAKKGVVASCVYCSRSFSEQWVFNQHAIKNGMKDYTCPICQVRLPAICMKLKHLLQHTKEFVLLQKCLICDKFTVFLEEKEACKHERYVHFNKLKKDVETEGKCFFMDYVLIPKSCLTTKVTTRSMEENIIFHTKALEDVIKNKTTQTLMSIKMDTRKNSGTQQKNKKINKKQSMLVIKPETSKLVSSSSGMEEKTSTPPLSSQTPSFKIKTSPATSSSSTPSCKIKVTHASSLLSTRKPPFKVVASSTPSFKAKASTSGSLSTPVTSTSKIKTYPAATPSSKLKVSSTPSVVSSGTPSTLETSTSNLKTYSTVAPSFKLKVSSTPSTIVSSGTPSTPGTLSSTPGSSRSKLKTYSTVTPSSKLKASSTPSVVSSGTLSSSKTSTEKALPTPSFTTGTTSEGNKSSSGTNFGEASTAQTASFSGTDSQAPLFNIVIKEEPIDEQEFQIKQEADNYSQPGGEYSTEMSTDYSTDFATGIQIKQEFDEESNEYVIQESQPDLSKIFGVKMEPDEEIKEEPEYEDDIIKFDHYEDYSIDNESDNSKNNNDNSELVEIPQFIDKISRKKKRIPKLYRCHKCGFEATHREYRYHLRTLCDAGVYGKGKYTCTKCCTHFDKFSKYIKHFAEHGFNVLKCIVCARMFTSVADIVPHLSRHIRMRYVPIRFISRSDNQLRFKYQCKICQLNVSKEDFFQHWEDHFTLKEVEAAKDNTEIPKVADMEAKPIDGDMISELLDRLRLPDYRNHMQMKCIICQRNFSRKNDCKRHLIEHLLSDAYSKKTLHGCLKCQICPKGFLKPDSYKKHMRDHACLPIYQCQICDKTFSDSSNFAKHKKLHNINAYQCDTCGKKFTVKSSIEKHMKLHEAQQPIVCQLCNEVFSLQSLYKRHVKGHHSKHKFPCQTCKVKFDTLKAKWDHMWYEHGERKIKADCSICNHSYRKISDLNRHMKDKHREHITFVRDRKSKRFKTDIKIVKSKTLNNYMQTKIVRIAADNPIETLIVYT